MSFKQHKTSSTRLVTRLQKITQKAHTLMKHSLIRKCTEAETAEATHKRNCDESLVVSERKLNQKGRKRGVERGKIKLKDGMLFVPLFVHFQVIHLSRVLCKFTSSIVQNVASFYHHSFTCLRPSRPSHPFPSINSTLSIRLLVKWMGTSLTYLTRLGRFISGLVVL